MVDGIARHVYPTKADTPDHEQRFKRLIIDKLYWGPKAKGWYHQQTAAKKLYTEFRNPLVHELAIEPAGAQPDQTNREPTVGKWADVQPQDIDKIDAMLKWNDDWPTLSVQNYEGGKRLKLSCAALYWAVKNMVNTLAADTAILNAAAAFHHDPKPPRSPHRRL